MRATDSRSLTRWRRAVRLGLIFLLLTAGMLWIRHRWSKSAAPPGHELAAQGVDPTNSIEQSVAQAGQAAFDDPEFIASFLAAELVVPGVKAEGAVDDDRARLRLAVYRRGGSRHLPVFTSLEQYRRSRGEASDGDLPAYVKMRGRDLLALAAESEITVTLNPHVVEAVTLAPDELADLLE